MDSWQSSVLASLILLVVSTGMHVNEDEHQAAVQIFQETTQNKGLESDFAGFAMGNT